MKELYPQVMPPIGSPVRTLFPAGEGRGTVVAYDAEDAVYRLVSVRNGRRG